MRKVLAIALGALVLLAACSADDGSSANSQSAQDDRVAEQLSKEFIYSLAYDPAYADTANGRRMQDSALRAVLGYESSVDVQFGANVSGCYWRALADIFLDLFEDLADRAGLYAEATERFRKSLGVPDDFRCATLEDEAA